MQIDNLKYVSLESPEINSGKKNLLYIEMELLKVIRRYVNYQKLRKGEFGVKHLVKKTVTELKAELENLDTLLPKVPVEKPQVPRMQYDLQSNAITPAMLSHMKLIKAPPAKRDILEEQIEAIQRKIAALS